MANVSSSNGLEKRPKLRFPGFEEPWKDTFFSDLYEAVSEKNDGSFGVENIISVANMYFKEDARITDEEYLKTYNIFKVGDIAFEGNKSNDFSHGRFVENTIGDGIVSHVFVVFRPLHDTHNLRYWKYAINNESVMGRILARCTKKTTMMTNLVTKDFLNQTILCPSAQEQDKIANLLDGISERIKLQKLYVESLKKYKRGALKAVFTQQVSFSAKPQKWDKYKMGDLISLQSGQDFAPAEYNDQEIGVPYMTGASCIVKGETVVSRWTQIPRCYAYKGDTLLVCKGSGSGAVVRLTQEKAHIARQFMSLRANEKMTSDFCYYLTGFLSDRIKRNATGLIEGIDRGTVLNQTVFLPPLHEQKKIARFFSKLDFTITAHENMLDTLINERTGLMQRLFI